MIRSGKRDADAQAGKRLENNLEKLKITYFPSGVVILIFQISFLNKLIIKYYTICVICLIRFSLPTRIENSGGE